MNLNERFAELRRSKPFHPFRIMLTDGRAVEVKEPLAFGWNEIMVMVAQEGRAAVRLRVEEISGIEQLETIA